MKTILASIDYSEVSDRVVSTAADLAEALKGTVVLVHVLRPPELVTTYDLVFVNDPTLAEAQKSADLELAKYKKYLDDRNVSAKIRRPVGYPAVEIIDQAQRTLADYIVIGSRGHTALYDLILGSTTTAVIKGADCPVMVVPPYLVEKRKNTRAELADLGQHAES